MPVAPTVRPPGPLCPSCAAPPRAAAPRLGRSPDPCVRVTAPKQSIRGEPDHIGWETSRRYISGQQRPRLAGYPRFPHRKRACSGAAVSQFSCCSWVSRASRRLQARPNVVPTTRVTCSGFKVSRWYCCANMYPRLKRVRRGDQVHEYVQLVEGRREAGKVRQCVVATFGRLDELKASGQLDWWAGVFTRLDPLAAGVHREVGPLLVVVYYLRRFGLVGLVDAAAPMRGRAQAIHGEVIAALVANRLSGPAPLYDVVGWAGAYAVAELLGVPAGLLNDDRLGRALDALAPVVEDVRARMLLATLERFEVEASRLHLDLTAVRFAGAYLDSALVAKGWAADCTVGRQVRALFATTAQGVTLYARPQKGSQAELDGIAAALEALRRLCPPGLVTVIDSAAGNLKTLAAIDRQKLRFVVPLRADNGWAARF